MADGIFYPVVSGDDGCAKSPGGGSFYPSLTSLYMGDHVGTDYSTWIRFPSIIIPQGATITSAFVRLTASYSDSGNDCNLNCYFNNEDNAVAPNNTAAFEALSLTSVIAWNTIAGWTDGNQYDTPSLVSILQNIVDRGGWSSGNAVQVIIKENTSSYDAKRRAAAIDFNSGAEKAELHIEWAVSPSEGIIDLLSEISTRKTVLADLNTAIKSLRSKWWLNTEIQAGVPDIGFITLNTFIDSKYPVWEKFLLLRYDHIPARNAQNVKTGKVMQFRLYNPDTAFGIDITKFKVRFDGGVWYRYGNSRLTFTKVNYREYLVYFNPPNLPYDTQITAELYCEDHRNNPGIKLEIF